MKTFEKSNCLAEMQLTYKTKVKPADRPKITQSKDIFALLHSIYDQDTVEHIETFVILMLNRANKVLGWAKISTGGTTGTVVDAKVVFQFALNANANALVLSHSHPSGNIQPSQQDIELTKKLVAGAKLLDIQILDHIIYTPDAYYSLMDEGAI